MAQATYLITIRLNQQERDALTELKAKGWSQPALMKLAIKTATKQKGDKHVQSSN